MESSLVYYNAAAEFLSEIPSNFPHIIK